MRPGIIVAVLSLALAGAACRAESLAEPLAEPLAASLHDRFAPEAFAAADLAVLKAALAAEGDLRGATDGAWGRQDDDALAAYAARRFGEAPPRQLHAGVLAADLAARLDREHWALQPQPDYGLTLALPADVFGAPELEEGGLRLWALDGSLTILLHRFSATGARHWHAAAAAAGAGPGAVERHDTPSRLLTRGRLEDGRLFATLSLPVGSTWATTYIAADPAAATTLALIESGIAPIDATRSAAPWRPAPNGTLAAAVAGTARLGRALAVPPVPTPAAVRLPDADGTQATGTGFYVSDRVLVTADHVVAGCSRVTLKDGTELALLAADADRDVAAFAAPAPASAWFGLGAPAAPRLGQRVHAAGFPYFSIVGTALNLTGGNVSALAGVGDDRRFFAFTAPVQPGNSGGPLIGDDGRVAGIVVSRISEQFIIEETGSLPQNMNFALSRRELIDFLSARDIDFQQADAGFALDEGAPPELESAVVPLLCY